MSSIKDVARLAGVSPSTVSLVLNESPLVKHETAYKVRQAIEELHYVPNQAARSLVTKEKKVISLIHINSALASNTDGDSFETCTDTLLIDMFPGVQNVLFQQGYSILTKLVPMGTPLDKIDIFDKAKIDGAIFIGGLITESLVESVRKSGIPVVYAYVRHKNTDYVDSDPEQGIYLATRHLIQSGHRDIALINSSKLSRTNELKLSGYQRALEEAGLPFQKNWVKDSEYIGRAAYCAMQELWEQGIHPTAVVGGSDNIALGAYRFLYEQGLRCPQDISIVGYESGLLSAHCVPPMTSVCVWRREVGAEAAKILINRIRNPKAKPINMIIPPKLTCGETVAPIEK